MRREGGVDGEAAEAERGKERRREREAGVEEESSVEQSAGGT